MLFLLLTMTSWSAIKLTPEQYRCTQENGTEEPFKNAYWNHHEDGMYVDVVTGEPLFSSLDKFDSGSGWPSFTQPLTPLIEKEDRSLGSVRTEIRSKSSHLGHVFADGPLPSGRRYCVNSASLQFVPLAELDSQGYGRFLFLFAEKKKWSTATFAGGCFWGVESLLRKRPGVSASQVGYAGGKQDGVTYDDVKKGSTGHAEAVQVLYDPKQVTYAALVAYFFNIHDPTTKDRQQHDVGSQYRSVIFYANDEEKAEVLKIKARAAAAWAHDVVTEVMPFQFFVRAEEEHQQYLLKHPTGYSCHFDRKKKIEP